MNQPPRYAKPKFAIGDRVRVFWPHAWGRADLAVTVTKINKRHVTVASDGGELIQFLAATGQQSAERGYAGPRPFIRQMVPGDEAQLLRHWAIQQAKLSVSRLCASNVGWEFLTDEELAEVGEQLRQILRRLGDAKAARTQL